MYWEEETYPSIVIQRESKQRFSFAIKLPKFVYDPKTRLAKNTFTTRDTYGYNGTVPSEYIRLVLVDQLDRFLVDYFG